MRHVILFGGSFDPIHNGHLAVAKNALKGRHADELWFIPTKMNPFKEDSVSFEHRYTMIEAAINGFDSFKVIEAEKYLPSPSYTIDTVKLLIKENPDTHFDWLVGSDQIDRLGDWKDAKELQELIQFVVYYREGHNSKHNFPTVEGTSFNVSSTEIRLGTSTNAPRSVLNYMTQHTLYTQKMLKEELSDYRYKHVMAVHDLALEIAEHHNMDINEVKVATLYHDICKEDDKDTLDSLMKHVYPEYHFLNPSFYHAFAAKDLLTRKYYYHNKNVLRAIVNHVSGNASNPIAMLLYIADKCERTRPWDSEDIIRLAKKDLRLGFKAVKERTQNHLKEKGVIE